MTNEETIKSSWASKTGAVVRIPLLVVFTAVFAGKAAKQLGWLSEENLKMLDPLISPSASLKMLFSLGLIFVGLMSVKTVVDDKKAKAAWRFRIVLSAFFILYAYVVTHGLIPMEEVAPRIDFKGVLCVATFSVISFFCLVGRYRLFLISSWLFMVWVGFPQMEKRMTFLEMMLEPLSLERAAYFGLAVVFLTLLSPRALQMFHVSASEYKAPAPLLFKKGFPF